MSVLLRSLHFQKEGVKMYDIINQLYNKNIKPIILK